MQGCRGILCVELADGAHHFRLYPDAEVYPAGVCVLDERGKPMGEFAGIGYPIAQRAGVVISLAEPSVIQHEHFCAQLGGSGDKLADGLFIYIKMHALPAIEEGAACFLSMGDDAAAHVAVEAAAGMPRAAGAEGEDSRG